MTPDELKQAQKDLGRTQRGLAEILGVSRNTVNRWQMGLHPIPPTAAAYVHHLLTCPTTTTTEPKP